MTCGERRRHTACSWDLSSCFLSFSIESKARRHSCKHQHTQHTEAQSPREAGRRYIASSNPHPPTIHSRLNTTFTHNLCVYFLIAARTRHTACPATSEAPSGSAPSAFGWAPSAFGWAPSCCAAAAAVAEASSRSPNGPDSSPLPPLATGRGAAPEHQKHKHMMGNGSAR